MASGACWVAFLSGWALRAAPPSTATSDTPTVDAQETEQSESTFPSPDHPFRLEASGGGAFGNASLPSGESLNAYGPGLGLRAGYTFAFGASAALRYDHFFGSTSSYPVPLVALIEHRTGASFVAADLGFELTPNHAILRPHVGLGLLGLRTSVKCDPVDGAFRELADDLCRDQDQSETSWRPAAAPGLLMGLGSNRYYGFVDVQYLLREGANAFAIAGGFGLTL
jgi:hypothetical protein